MIVQRFPRLHSHIANFTLVGKHVWEVKALHMVPDISSVQPGLSTNFTLPLQLTVKVCVFSDISQQLLWVSSKSFTRVLMYLLQTSLHQAAFIALVSLISTKLFIAVLLLVGKRVVHWANLL